MYDTSTDYSVELEEIAAQFSALLRDAETVLRAAAKQYPEAQKTYDRALNYWLAQLESNVGGR